MNTLLILALLILPAIHAQTGSSFLPACHGPHMEFADRTYFVLCHDSSLKLSTWTAYEMTPDNLSGDSFRPSHFRHDAQLVGGAHNADYKNSGFSRGHLVPARDMAFSDAAIGSTFLLTNVIPQNQTVNAGKWRQLENAVRELAASADILIVFTGPVFDTTKETQFIEPAHVAIPTHMYKVVLARKGEQKTMYAVIIPNAPAPGALLNSFAITVEEVELRTGLDFFSGLEDEEERRLESARHLFPAR